jgi:hypothetical protein
LVFGTTPCQKDAAPLPWLITTFFLTKEMEKVLLFVSVFQIDARRDLP